ALKLADQRVDELREQDRDAGKRVASLTARIEALGMNLARRDGAGCPPYGPGPAGVITRTPAAAPAELIDWTRELIADPQPEQRQYVAGLSILAALPPDEVIELLGRRIEALNEQIAGVRAEFDAVAGALPRLFMVETEYGLAMLEAERAWTVAFRDELVSGTFPGLDGWRAWHAEGMDQAKAGDLMEGGTAHS
ncbi:PadR family transcriptional regulator, partial [Nocardia cyriacigeorgica]|uniref:PadR family transcriptional regulator n=1 Tax=Nocardia cyriacigeorgica TaxID=135487 RepID=UPI002455D177